MARVNYSAQSAGIAMDTLIGILTVGQEVSQRAPEEVGNAWRTVIARIQNVKAGKFAANYSDIESSDYNESDWEALNDVETTMKAIGISMRDGATAWRNTEDVLNEVASKWDTFDDITRSAVANAMAGTRQREQFILMMQNWDSVQQYAEMAANSYGAATEKMEAYTDSIEASKSRVTAAWEQLALDINLTGIVKDFYSTIAFIIDNLKALGIALGAIMLTKVASNFATLGKLTTVSLPALVNRLVAFGEAIAQDTWSFRRNSDAVDRDTYKQNKKQTEGSLINGTVAIAGMVGTIGGGLAGSSLGTKLGDKWGIDSGTASTIGSVLGSAAGLGIVKAATIAGNLIGGPVGGAVGAIAGAGITALASIKTYFKDKKDQEKTEAAQQSFQESETALNEASGKLEYAKTIDELRDGVSATGENLALTEEEYEKFIEANKELAETFPSLVDHWDENGNAIIDLGLTMDTTGEKAKSLADIISEEIERLRQEADEKLMGGELAGKAIGQAQEEIIALDKTITTNPTTLESKRAQAQELEDEIAKGEATAKNNKLAQAILRKKKENLEKLQEEITGLEAEGAELQTPGYRDTEIKDIIQENLSTYILAAFRLNENYSKDFSSIQQQATQDLITNMGGELIMDTVNMEEDEKAKYFQEKVDAAVAQTQEFFEANSKIERYMKQADTASTLGEQHKANQKMITTLNDIKNPTEGDIAVAKTLGVDYHNGNFILEGEKDLYGTIMNSFEGAATNRKKQKYISGLTTEQGQRMARYGQQGIGFETAQQLLYTDSIDSSTLEGASKLVDIFTNVDNEAIVKYFSEIQEGSEITAKDVAENFSELPETARNAIQEAAQEVADGDKEAVEGINDVSAALQTQLANKIGQVNKGLLDDLFTSDWDIDDNGMIDTFSELKNVLDEVADSFNKLKDAQKEQNATGHLSFQTALDLVSSNEAYLNCLEVEDGQIKLTANAQKTLTLAQMQAALSSLQQMRATMLKDAAEVAARLSTVNSTDATNDSIEAGNEAVKSSNDNATALATEAQVAAETAKAIDKLNKVRKGGELTEEEYNDLVEGIKSSTEEVTVSTKSTAQTVKSTYTEAQQKADRKQWKYYTGKEYDDEGDNDVYAIEEAFMNGDDSAYTTTYDDGSKSTGALGVSGAMELALQKKVDKGDTSGWVKNYETPTIDDNAKKKWERIKDILAAINKEYKQMIASGKKFSDNTKEITMSVEDYFKNVSGKYFKTMKTWYNKELKALKKSPYYGMSLDQIYAAGYDDDTLAEALSVYQEVEDVKMNLANLDDEEIQDKIDVLETQGHINDAIIEEYKLLVKSADSVPERLEYEAKLNEKLKERIELVKTLQEFEQSILDFELQYVDGQPDSKRYKELIEMSKANLEAQRDNALANASSAYQKAYDDAYSDAKAAKYSDAAAAAMATEAAEMDADYQGYIQDYLAAIEAIGDLAMKVFNDRINMLQRRMTELEMSKPNEWASDWDEKTSKVTLSAISKIKTYYTSVNSYYQQMADAAQKTLLESAKDLTDAQIQELTEKYNEAMKNIRDTSAEMCEDIKTYQESVYSALTSEIEEYKSQLEKQKEIIEETYDKEIEKLNDKNAAIERTNKLLELQQNLLNAQKEKERVFRQGEQTTPLSNYIG